jgi:hypothetical protein
MELRTDRIKVPPLAPAAQSAPAAAAWIAFEAATAAGGLRLWAWGAVRHAADAAVLLEACAPLLDALEAWIDFAPAWRWCPQGPSAGAAPQARAQWQPPGEPSGTSGCRIDLPWALLRSLSPPAEALAAQLHWSVTPAVLVLTHMALSDEDIAALEPGGAVLLPASMEPEWQGRLRACDELASPVAGLPVALPRPWTPVPTAGRDTAAHGDDAACEVRLGMPRTLDARALAGWQACEPFEPDTRVSLWRCAGDSGPAQVLASGVLMPWGDGWALQIDAAA